MSFLSCLYQSKFVRDFQKNKGLSLLAFFAILSYRNQHGMFSKVCEWEVFDVIKTAPIGWFGGKWFLVRDYAVMDSPHAMKSFAAGGIAGMLSKIVVAPVERVKLLTQIEGLRTSRRSIIRIAYDVWHLEGFQAFWKGNGPTVLRVIPNKGILCLCNDYYLSPLRVTSPCGAVFSPEAFREQLL